MALRAEKKTERIPINQLSKVKRDLSTHLSTMIRRRIDEKPIDRLKRTVPREIWEHFKGVDITHEVAEKLEDDWRAFKASAKALADTFPTFQITPKYLRPRAVHKAVRALHKRKPWQQK